VEGTLVIDEEYSQGLRDIEPGQRVVVIFNFHPSSAFSLDFLRQNLEKLTRPSVQQRDP
jgi:tRNA (Thr-GGU) A37 N-methylase